MDVLTEMLSCCFHGVGGSANRDAHGTIFPGLAVTVEFLPILPSVRDR